MTTITLSSNEYDHICQTLRARECGECMNIVYKLDLLTDKQVGNDRLTFYRPLLSEPDLAGHHSCDQACCDKVPGKYCADDDCNCGAAGNHAALPAQDLGPDLDDAYRRLYDQDSRISRIIAFREYLAFTLGREGLGANYDVIIDSLDLALAPPKQIKT